MVSSDGTDSTPFEILQDNFISAKGRFTSCGSVAFVKADGSVVSENAQLCALTNVRDFCGTFESSVADSIFLFYLIRNQYDEFVLVSGFQPTALQQKNMDQWLNTLLTSNTKRIWTSCISFETISPQKWLLAGITPDGRVITNDRRNGISAVNSWRNITKVRSGELFFYGITNQGSVRIASYQLNTSAIASDIKKEINIYLSSNQLQAVDICPCEETGVGGRAKVAVLLNNHCIRGFGEWGKKLQHKSTLERMSGVVQLLRDYTAYMGNFLAEERFDGVYRNGKIFEININGILSDKTLLDGKKCVGIFPMFGINVRRYMTEDFRITSNSSSNHRVLVKSGQDRMEKQAAFEKIQCSIFWFSKMHMDSLEDFPTDKYAQEQGLVRCRVEQGRSVYKRCCGNIGFDMISKR